MSAVDSNGQHAGEPGGWRQEEGCWCHRWQGKDGRGLRTLKAEYKSSSWKETRVKKQIEIKEIDGAVQERYKECCRWLIAGPASVMWPANPGLAAQAGQAEDEYGRCHPGDKGTPWWRPWPAGSPSWRQSTLPPIGGWRSSKNRWTPRLGRTGLTWYEGLKYRLSERADHPFDPGVPEIKIALDMGIAEYRKLEG